MLKSLNGNLRSVSKFQPGRLFALALALVSCSSVNAFVATTIFLPGCLAAATIFTTGPDAGIGNVPAISSGYAVTESFTINSSVTLNQITFADWATTGTTATSIDWEITSQPNAGVLFSATGATLSSTLVRTGIRDDDGNLNNVYNSSFQTVAVNLGPGTYWLLLQNCSPAPACGWGLSSNSGSAEQFLNGSLSASGFGSESLTLSGSAAVVSSPEPTGSLVAGGLFLAVALARRRR